MNLRSTSFALLALTACGGPLEPGTDSDEALADTSMAALNLSPDESSAVLALVNYPGSDAKVLDDRAGLDARAAKNIIARRNGADGVTPSADDRPFASIAELDAVPYVGDAAFVHLAAYARLFPAPAGETVEGVSFSGWQAAAVVYGVNTIEPYRLDAMLDARAASGLLAARPFTTVSQLGPVAFVGVKALQRLWEEAPRFWAVMQNPSSPPPAQNQAGTYDGVTFDEATALKALELSNHATRDELVAGGLPAAPAAAIIGNRPFAHLSAVAAVGGVGTATLQALQRLAAAGQVDPLAALKAELESLTQGLLLMSETDARFFFVSAPNIGSQPITEALLRQVLAAQHDALIGQVMYVPAGTEPLSTRLEFEQYDGVQWFDHIIDNADPNDPDSLARAEQFKKLRDALTSQLTELKVYRFGRINISTFILGRTSNGALAGLLSGQVET
ncbi:MAG: hypothetical protein IPJ65_33655 [Archangiaceae bacterium]|nr:hypothetical protein [Archangiaceae bacterium]